MGASGIWFESKFDVEKRAGGCMLGEHASALVVDLQAIYCAGVYLTVVILACTIIDAHLREVEGGEKYEGGIQAAFSELTSISGLDWLRKRRNHLVHFRERPTPTITVEDQYLERKNHEADACRAIELVSRVLFENPWT